MRAVRLFKALSHQLSHRSINMFISLSKNKLYLQFLSHKRDKQSEVTHERITNKLSHFIDQNESKYESQQFYKRLTIQYHAELMAEIQTFTKYLKNKTRVNSKEVQKDITQLTQQIKHQYFKYYYLQMKHQKITDKIKQQNKMKILQACEIIHIFNRDLASNIIQRIFDQDINNKQSTNIRKSIIQLINQHSTIPQFIKQRFISFYDPSKLNYIRNQQQPRFEYGSTGQNSNCFNPTLITCQIIQRVNDAQQLNLLIMGDKKIGKSFSLFHYRLLSEYLPCTGIKKSKFIYFPSVVDALKPSTTAEILFNQYYRQLPKYLLLLIKDLCCDSQQNTQKTNSNPKKYISQIKIYEQDLKKFKNIFIIINEILGQQNVQYSTQQKTFKFKKQLTPMQTLKILINLVKAYAQNFRTTIACFDQFNDLTRKEALQNNQNLQQNVIEFIKLFFEAKKRVMSASFHIEKNQYYHIFKRVIPPAQNGPDKKSELVIYSLKPANYQQVNQFERQKTYNILKRKNKEQSKLKMIKSKMEKKSQMVKTLKQYNLPFNCEDFKNLNQRIFMQCLKLQIEKTQENMFYKYQIIIRQQLNKIRQDCLSSVVGQLIRWITKSNQKQIFKQSYQTVLQMMYSSFKPTLQNNSISRDLPLRIYNIQTNTLHQFIKDHDVQIYNLIQKRLESSPFRSQVSSYLPNFVGKNTSIFGQYIQAFFYLSINYFIDKIDDVFPLNNITKQFQKIKIPNDFVKNKKGLAEYITNSITHINQPYIFQTHANTQALDMVLAVVKLERSTQKQNIESLQNHKDQLILQLCFVEIGLSQRTKLQDLVKYGEDEYLKGFQQLKWESNKDQPNLGKQPQHQKEKQQKYQQKIYKYSKIQRKYLLAYFRQRNNKQDSAKNPKKQKRIKQIIKQDSSKIIQKRKRIKQIIKQDSSKIIQERIQQVIKKDSVKKNVQMLYPAQFKIFAEQFRENEIFAEQFRENDTKSSK